MGRPTKIAYTGCSKLFSSSTWLCKKYCGALLLSHWQRPLAVQFTSPLHRVPVRERVCVYQYIISVSGVIRAVVVNWETQRVADALKRGRHASQTHWTLNLLLDVRSQCLNRRQLMNNCFIIEAIHRAHAFCTRISNLLRSANMCPSYLLRYPSNVTLYLWLFCKYHSFSSRSKIFKRLSSGKRVNTNDLYKLMI